MNQSKKNGKGFIMCTNKDRAMDIADILVEYQKELEADRIDVDQDGHWFITGPEGTLSYNSAQEQYYVQCNFGIINAEPLNLFYQVIADRVDSKLKGAQ